MLTHWMNESYIHYAEGKKLRARGQSTSFHFMKLWKRESCLTVLPDIWSSAEHPWRHLVHAKGHHASVVLPKLLLVTSKYQKDENRSCQSFQGLASLVLENHFHSFS